MNILLKKFFTFLKWTRYKEILLLSSPGLMGLVLGKYSLFMAGHDGKLITMIVFFIALCLGGAHVFLFNLWSGIKLSTIDAAHIDYPLQQNEIHMNAIFMLSFASLAFSLIINFLLNSSVFIASIIIAILWIFYAYPRGLFLKSHFIGGLAVHYINGSLHFLIGYFLFNNLTLNAVFISHYFSLIFLAGYFHHILKDRESDKLMKIKTLATSCNPRIIFITGNALFAASYLLLGLLVLMQILPYSFFLWNTIIILLLVYRFRQTVKTDLSKEKILAYRKFYRFLYTLLGILFVFSVYKGWP